MSNQYEITLYKLVARNNPMGAYNLLLEYGEAPNKTYEDIEEGLRSIVRSNGDVALKRITALHPHLDLFRAFPDVLGLPEHKDEKQPKEEPKPQEKHNACGCMNVDGQTTPATNTTTTTTQSFFTPTNITIIAISVSIAIIAVAIGRR